MPGRGCGSTKQCLLVRIGVEGGGVDVKGLVLGGVTAARPVPAGAGPGQVVDQVRGVLRRTAARQRPGQWVARQRAG